MKERIAKIIQDGVCSGDSSWDEITLEILKAMREPTEKMKATEGFHTNCFTCGGHVEGWRAGIDAIINE